MEKKFKVLILSVVAVVAIGALAVGIHSNNVRVEKQKIYNSHVQKVLKGIDKDFNNFNSLADDAKKLDALKVLEKEFKAYSKGNEKDSKIIKKYEKDVKESKDYFINKNIKDLDALKVTDVKTESKDSLNSKVNTAKNILTAVNNEKNLVYTEKEVTDISTKANALIKTYEDQVKVLEKAEADAAEKAKQEQEAQAQSAAAAATATAQDNGQASDAGSQGYAGASAGGGSVSQGSPSYSGGAAASNGGGYSYSAPSGGGQAQAQAPSGGGGGSVSSGGSYSDPNTSYGWTSDYVTGARSDITVSGGNGSWTTTVNGEESGGFTTK